MFCSECGNEISASAKFCPSCGAKQIITRDLKTENDLENKEFDIFFNFSLDEFIRLEDYKIKQILIEAVEFFRNNDPKIANYIKNNILQSFQGDIYPDSIEDLFEKLIDLENKSNKNNINNPKSKNTNNTSLSSTILKSVRHKNKKNDSTSKNWNSNSILKGFFFIWLTNTILANLIGTGTSLNNVWEGWYIPPLSEIAPVLIKEISIFGEGDFRLATQAEVWRMNRTVRQIREGIEDITGQDLDLDDLQKDFDENLKDFQDLLREMKEDLDY